MTTWMRTLHSLQPKLSIIKATTTSKSSGTLAATATVTGSGHQEVAGRPTPQSVSLFLNEFLELGSACRSTSTLSWPDETRSRVPVSVLIPIQKSTSSSPSSAAASVAKCLNSDDLRLHGMITTKPRTLSADDIISDSCEVIKCDIDNCDYQNCLSFASMDGVLLPESIVIWHRQSLSLSPYEASMILSLSLKAKATTGKADPTGKPAEEHLQRVLLKLSDDLPQFFSKAPDYSIYHKNLVFRNNIRGVTTYGLLSYVRVMTLTRIIGHLKFSYVEMEVLKVTKHSEDGTVRVRWRIRGIPGYRVFLQLWKFPLWRYKDMMTIKADWYDGFSTFHVGGDGLVHSHVCDKMMPDEQKEKNVSSKTNLAAKLALLLGAIPRPSADDLGAVFVSLSMLQQQLNRQLSTTTTTAAAASSDVTSTGSD